MLRTSRFVAESFDVLKQMLVLGPNSARRILIRRTKDRRPFPPP
jgi:hypothetical protein